MMNGIKKPDFVIVGAPKCGTTAMADYIGQHPDIYMPDAKDSHFWGSDLNFIHNINHPANRFRVNEKTFLSWYYGRGEKMLGEASVMYLYSRKAAKEIKTFNSQMKIIIMLRNPVDMIYSLHAHYLSDLNEDIESFEEALKAEGDRKKGIRIPVTAYVINGLFYSEVAKYTEQVQRYLDVFGRKNIHVIIFDDFIRDTAGVYRDTLNFLGVDVNFQAEFRQINPSKQIRNKTLQRIIVNPPEILKPVGITLSRILWLSQFVKKVLFFINVKHEKRPAMEPQLREQLQKIFTPEVERLGALLCRDLSFWNS